MPHSEAPRADPAQGLLALLALLSVLAAPASGLAQTLTARQAVQRAAQHNPALRATMADVSAAHESVRAQLGARRPVFYSSLDANYNEGFVATPDSVLRTDNQGIGLGAGLRYTTNVGTELDVSLGSDVTWRSTNVTPASAMLVTLGPVYSAQLGLTLRQPLLRGAGDDAALSAIREARQNHEGADHTRDDAASQLALDVLTAYWELWYAERALRVRMEAQGVSERQVEWAQIRVEQLGVAQATDVLRFRSELATIRSEIASSRSTSETRAIELGRLFGAAPTGVNDLEASDEPQLAEAPPPLADLLESASTSSSVLASLAEVGAGRERSRLAADGDQARLDLTASLTGAALWSDDSLQGLQVPDGRPALTGVVGVELELPIGDAQAAAEYRRSRAQLDAAEARYESQLQAVRAEIARLRVLVVAASEQVTLTAEVADLARRLAEAERTRLDLGTTTSTDVVEAQQSHREAELSHLRAIVDQKTAALQLDHRVGRLLERYALEGER